MRGMTHRWELPTEGSPRGASDGGLARRVLWARGYRGEAEAAEFLEPKLTRLHEPSLLAGVDEAAELLLGAARTGKKIAIYGDYDVDGVSGTSILWRVLRAVAPSADVRTYIPHRLEEGYGVNEDALRGLRAEGVDVVVTVDCGITAVGPARVARELGMAFVVTDHHEMGAELPSADVVAHPRVRNARTGEAYPFGDLCGAGVAFKLGWRIATLAAGGERVGEDVREVLLDCLALAALGTVADVVPLVGENRVIARFGLSRVGKSGIEGLGALVEASGLGGGRVDAEGVGFMVAPRLNAAGRMGHAREALELLTTARGERAWAIARALSAKNEERKRTERSIFAEADAAAEDAGMCAENRRAIVLAREGWHAGVLGIVCSRLVERRRRPTILMRLEDGECHGSGRSVDGVDLHEGLTACADLLEGFGGHAMAAGVRVKASRLEAFAERFTGWVNERVGMEDLEARMRVDCEAGLEEMSVREVEGLERLGPFGRGNPGVRVLVRGVEMAGRAETMGAQGKHLALTVRRGGKVMRCVAWNWGERRDALRAGMELSMVLEPKVSRWGSRVSVEPVVKDVCVTRG